jgi:hypothetical protein
MGMSGHESAGPLRACVKVDNCCDPFSVCTLTCVKTLVTVLRAFYHRIRMIHKSTSFYFILVRMIRSSCIASSHLIKEA